MAEYLAENSRLRQLSRQHAEGGLSLEDYRAARRKIIDALEAGRAETPAASWRPAPPAPAGAAAPLAAAAVPGEDKPQAEDNTVFYKTLPPRAAAAEEHAPVAPAPSWDGHARILAAVLGVALLLAMAALLYVFAL